MMLLYLYVWIFMRLLLFSKALKNVDSELFYLATNGYLNYNNDK